LCSIVWIESPARGRALMLSDISTNLHFPKVNRLALIGDLDSGEVVSSTLIRWLETHGRSIYNSQWRRLLPDRSDYARGQAITFFAAKTLF
jgi:hypothetical protein